MAGEGVLPLSLGTAAAVVMLKHGEKWQVLLGPVTHRLEERGGLCGMGRTAELRSKLCLQWWLLAGAAGSAAAQGTWM